MYLRAAVHNKSFGIRSSKKIDLLKQKCLCLIGTLFHARKFIQFFREVRYTESSVSEVGLYMYNIHFMLSLHVTSGLVTTAVLSRIVITPWEKEVGRFTGHLFVHFVFYYFK